MAAYWTDLFSYVTASVRAHDLGHMAQVADERAEAGDPHSYFLQWDDNTWGRVLDGSVSWSTVDSVVCTVPIEQTLFLGAGGEVQCVGSGEAHEEIIRPGQPDSPANRGMMRGIGSIAGKAYAVGMQRQVYKRNNANDWTCMDHTARPDPDDARVYSFEGIDGFAPGEVYAAGRQGEIWSYDGATWIQRESPTDMILTRVCCGGDGRVYSCGRVGTLVQGRTDRWDLIEQDTTDDDFWGMAWYNGCLYVATMHQVFRLLDGTLEPVDFGEDRPSSCFTLSSADGVLWSIGAKDVMAFDGSVWSRVD